MKRYWRAWIVLLALAFSPTTCQWHEVERVGAQEVLNGDQDTTKTQIVERAVGEIRNAAYQIGAIDQQIKELENELRRLQQLRDQLTRILKKANEDIASTADGATSGTTSVER